jgi:HTH-type transcriptional regulator / antitoxin HigA
VVWIRQTPKCRASGATQWLDGRPLIQLSLRYKKKDSLWFTFFHEAGHVLLHPNVEFVETKDDKADPREIEANEFAGDLLIPPDDFEHLKDMAPRYSKAAVLRFAATLRIDPGVVVGRLHKEKLIPFKNLQRLRTTVDWTN